MRYLFRVYGIVWAEPATNLPTETTIWLPGYLVDSGPEDHEREGFDDDLDDLDEDEAEEFWDNYEPSDEARDAWDAEWAAAVKDRLEADHGAKVLSVGGWEPHALVEPASSVNVGGNV